MSENVRVALLAFDNMTLLDLIGPHEVLWRVPEADVRVYGIGDVRAVPEGGLPIECDGIFGAQTVCDVLIVPGGVGVNDVLRDAPTLDALAKVGTSARLVASVCTGALLLGAAGLLRGYRATTHWRYRELLRHVGAEPVDERLVWDRDRMTGGGVTAGIDVGLLLVRELWGIPRAESIALMLEYDPQSPVRRGTPGDAEPSALGDVLAATRGMYERRERLLARSPTRIDHTAAVLGLNTSE